MTPGSQMDDDIRPDERRRQPIPSADIDGVRREIPKTARISRLDDSCHVVPCSRQRRGEVGSDESGTTRYDDPQFTDPNTFRYSANPIEAEYFSSNARRASTPMRAAISLSP